MMQLTKTSTTGAIARPGDSEDHDHCMICYDTLEYRALLPCNHNDICPICMLRLRHLHKDRKCPICKQECEQVIVERKHPDPASEYARFSDYNVWGEELGSDFVFKGGDVSTFYRVEYYEPYIQPLLSYPCLQCDEFTEEYGPTQQSLKVLQDHLRIRHRLQLCSLCTDNRRDFVSNLPRFTPQQLQLHFQNGDKGTAFTGHPLCEFCRPTRFYDTTQLYLHLNQEHYKCDLCEKMGIPNQFFKHYPSLQRHFHNQHFACQNPLCMEARFVVFESELDLRHHERQVHGTDANGTGGSSKISLEFRYASSRSSTTDPNQTLPSQHDFDYTLDGQAFVPPDLATTDNAAAAANAAIGTMAAAVMVDPLHRARTEQLRQRAAQVAQEQGLLPQQPEAFPSLQAATAAQDAGGGTTSTKLRVGWTSGGSQVMIRAAAQRKTAVGQVTESAFPSLSRPASAISLAASTRPSSSRGTSTLAAISQAAAQPGASSLLWQRPSNGVGTTSTTTTTATASESAPPTLPLSKPTPSAVPNLSSAEQFPSLGGGSSRTRSMAAASNATPAVQPYSAAQALARQQQQQQQPSSSSLDVFPSLGTVTTRSAPPPPPAAPIPPPQPPQWDNPFDFPAPPPTTSSAQAVVDDLKASLGKAKYKQLKKLTAGFSTGEYKGQEYLDQVVLLFDNNNGGCKDALFWNTVPFLIESCPAPANHKQSALNSLDKMRQNGQKKNGQPLPPQQRSSSLLSSALVATQQQPPPPSTTNTAAWPVAISSSSTTIPLASRPSGVVTTTPTTTTWGAAAPKSITSSSTSSTHTPGKTNPSTTKTTAWGSSTTNPAASSVLRAKAPPGSVAVAAAQPQQGPQSATKFMAQEQKKEKKKAAAVATKKPTTTSKKQELRSLAFGS